MKRPNPCDICAAEESAMVYASDPWCCDDCHKKAAELFFVDQSSLTVARFEEMKAALAKKFKVTIDYLEEQMRLASPWWGANFNG